MSRLTVLAAAFLVAGSALAQDASQTRYAVLIMEKPAGMQTSTLAADGLRNLSYEFNDRGRGPKVDSRLRLEAAGVPSLTVDGNEYFKGPVAERFTAANGAGRPGRTAPKRASSRRRAGAFYSATTARPTRSASW